MATSSIIRCQSTPTMRSAESSSSRLGSGGVKRIRRAGNSRRASAGVVRQAFAVCRRAAIQGLVGVGELLRIVVVTVIILGDGVCVVAWWHGMAWLRVDVRLSGAAAVLRGQLRGAKQWFHWSGFFFAGGPRLPQLVLEGVGGQSPGTRQPAPTGSHSFLPLACSPTPEAIPRPWDAISMQKG